MKLNETDIIRSIYTPSKVALAQGNTTQKAFQDKLTKISSFTLNAPLI
jgi:hypothetical protein